MMHMLSFCRVQGRSSNGNGEDEATTSGGGGGGDGTEVSCIQILSRLFNWQRRVFLLSAVLVSIQKWHRAATPELVAMMCQVLPPKFEFHAGHRLGCTKLLVDEASMLDLPLAAALLDALPSKPDFQLVLVGEQLPTSVTCLWHPYSRHAPF